MIIKEVFKDLRTAKEYTAFGMWGFFGFGIILKADNPFTLLPIIGFILVLVSFTNYAINIFKK